LEAGDRSHAPKMGYSAIKEVVETMYVDDLAFVTKPYGIFTNFRKGILKKIKRLTTKCEFLKISAVKDIFH